MNTVKVIRVESCGKCPYGRFGGSNPMKGVLYYKCIKLEPNLNFGQCVEENLISKKCPLEDLKEVEV